MLTLRHYEILITLAEELHFGRAAARLSISQPQLTQQLKQLEELLGTLLFDRTRRRVALTAAGALILPEARAVLRHSRRAEDVALRAGRGLLGELSVGYIGAAAYNGTLTGLLRNFRAKAVQIDLRLILMDLDRQIPEIAAGNLDVGIVRLPYPDLPAGLSVRTLCHESLWLALPVGHPLAAEPAIALGALEDADFIATHLPANVGFSAAMHAACAEAGIAPNIVYRAPQFTAIVSLVEAGLGVAIVPEAVNRVALPGVVYRPLKELSTRAEIALVYRTEAQSPPLSLFLSCVDDQIHDAQTHMEAQP